MPTLRLLSAAALAAGLAVVAPAQADTELRDRYITASQKMGQGMLQVIKACAPEVDTSGIDFEYSPRMIDAVDCVIETHIERFGREETVALVEQAEAMGERSFSTLKEMSDMQEDYPRLSDPVMGEIHQACGTIAASQDLPITGLMRENASKMAECFAGQ